MTYEHIPDKDWEIMRKTSVDLAKKIIEKMQDASSDFDPEELEIKAIQINELNILERKYGQHPWILDRRADLSDDPKEKIKLRKAALKLIENDEYELRAQFYYDLASDYYDEMGDKTEAFKWIDSAMEILDRIEDESLQKYIKEFKKDHL